MGTAGGVLLYGDSCSAARGINRCRGGGGTSVRGTHAFVGSVIGFPALCAGIGCGDRREGVLFLRFGLGPVRHYAARSTEQSHLGHFRSWLGFSRCTREPVSVLVC